MVANITGGPDGMFKGDIISMRISQDSSYSYIGYEMISLIYKKLQLRNNFSTGGTARAVYLFLVAMLHVCNWNE